MAEALEYTATEVAFVLSDSLKSVRKALDDGPIQPKLIPKSSGSVRNVEASDVLYLIALKSLRNKLTPEARNDFYRALKDLVIADAREVRFGDICVYLDEYKEEMQRRSKALKELLDAVENGPSGEKLLKGTNVEVHRIAALLTGGATVEMVCADYPSLNAEQVEVARIYAEAYPKPGRPFPRKSFKRVLSGAGLEALDEVLGE